MTSARSSKDLFPGGSESITALPKITAYPPLQVTGLERGHRAGHPPLAAAWDRSAACVQPGEFPFIAFLAYPPNEPTRGNDMSTRTVGIIGAGNMGRGLVRRLAKAGRRVMVADQHADRAEQVAAEAGADQPGTASGVPEEQALAADIVVLALWYPATVEFATANQSALAGKIVVDISNPLDESFTGLSLPPTTSGAEELAAALPNSRVVKAFNTVPAPTLFTGEVGGTTLDTFVAADDADAKAAVMDLLRDSGLRGLDAGALANSRLLERLTAFGIELGQRYGLGFDFGVKYLPTTDLSVQALHIPGAAAVQAVRRAVRHVTGIAGQPKQPDRSARSLSAWPAPPEHPAQARRGGLGSSPGEPGSLVGAVRKRREVTGTFRTMRARERATDPGAGRHAFASGTPKTPGQAN